MSYCGTVVVTVGTPVPFRSLPASTLCERCVKYRFPAAIVQAAPLAGLMQLYVFVVWLKTSPEAWLFFAKEGSPMYGQSCRDSDRSLTPVCASVASIQRK